MSLKEDRDRSYAARVARAQEMGLQRQNAETIIDEEDVRERKEAVSYTHLTLPTSDLV